MADTQTTASEVQFALTKYASQKLFIAQVALIQYVKLVKISMRYIETPF